MCQVNRRVLMALNSTLSRLHAMGWTALLTTVDEFSPVLCARSNQNAQLHDYRDVYLWLLTCKLHLLHNYATECYKYRHVVMAADL